MDTLITTIALTIEFSSTIEPRDDSVAFRFRVPAPAQPRPFQSHLIALPWPADLPPEVEELKQAGYKRFASPCGTTVIYHNSMGVH